MEVIMSMENYERLKSVKEQYVKLADEISRMICINTEVDEDNAVIYAELSISEPILLDIAKRFCTDYAILKDDISRIRIR